MATELGKQGQRRIRLPPLYFHRGESLTIFTDLKSGISKQDLQQERS